MILSVVILFHSLCLPIPLYVLLGREPNIIPVSASAVRMATDKFCSFYRFFKHCTLILIILLNELCMYVRYSTGPLDSIWCNTCMILINLICSISVHHRINKLSYATRELISDRKSSYKLAAYYKSARGCPDHK